MKKILYLTAIALISFSSAGCSENKEEPEIEPIKLSDIEGINYFEYDFTEGSRTLKTVKPGFVEKQYNEYSIDSPEFAVTLREYNWFDSQIKIENNVLTSSYNNGWISIDDDKFAYGISIEKYNIVEFEGRYFEDDEGYEMLFNKDKIIFINGNIYYSEDYLKSKGVQFFDAKDVLGEIIE